MAELHISIPARPRWWFTPLLLAVGFLMERGIIREAHAISLARWAGVHGLILG